MTVEQLIERLKQLDPKATVQIAVDAEGNDFKTLSDAECSDGVATLWPE